MKKLICVIKIRDEIGKNEKLWPVKLKTFIKILYWTISTVYREFLNLNDTNVLIIDYCLINFFYNCKLVLVDQSHNSRLNIFQLSSKETSRLFVQD